MGEMRSAAHMKARHDERHVVEKNRADNGALPCGSGSQYTRRTQLGARSSASPLGMLRDARFSVNFTTLLQA